MAKTCYYVLVNDRGNMIVTDHKLPFYWNREVAFNDAELFKAHVKPVRISEIQELLQIKPKGIILRSWM